MTPIDHIPAHDREQVLEVVQIIADINASLSLIAFWAGHKSLCAVFMYSFEPTTYHMFYLLECDYSLDGMAICNPRNPTPVLYPCQGMGAALTAAQDWRDYFKEELDKLFEEEEA